MLEKIGWNSKKVVDLLPPHKECPTPNLSLIMNIIVWNSRGILKPNFQNHMRELARNHNLAILVMETRLGGARAKEITDRLPFDGAIHTETVGFTEASSCFEIPILWRWCNWQILSKKSMWK